MTNVACKECYLQNWPERIYGFELKKNQIVGLKDHTSSDCHVAMVNCVPNGKTERYCKDHTDKLKKKSIIDMCDKWVHNITSIVHITTMIIEMTPSLC